VTKVTNLCGGLFVAYFIDLSLKTKEKIMWILIWILGAIATYRLWEDVRWLAIFAIILVLSYQVHPDEQQEQNKTGMFPTITANRLMWTFILVVIIFIYSLFI